MPLAELATVLGVFRNDASKRREIRTTPTSGRTMPSRKTGAPGDEKDGEDFLASRFGKAFAGPDAALDIPAAPTVNELSKRTRKLRERLQLSQVGFARLIGAANRAVSTNGNPASVGRRQRCGNVM